jgi:coatomer protein complex subunit gamma
MVSISEAVKQIIEYMGMQPCERSDRVPSDKKSHVLLLAGCYRGGHDVLVQTKLAFSDGVTMQITVRSLEANVSEVVLSAVG